MGMRRADGEAWVFPELDRSFKQIFLMQMLAFFILIGVVGVKFGALWFAVSFALSMLKDCIIVQAGIANARNRRISMQTQEALQNQRSAFPAIEGRLLNRDEMVTGPAPQPAYTTAELPPPDRYGE